MPLPSALAIESPAYGTEATPVRAAILGATFNTGNMGVSMLAAGAILCVLNRFPEGRVALFDYAREGYSFSFAHEGRQVPIEFVNIRFSKKFYLPNNVAWLIVLALLSRLIPWPGLRRRFAARNPYLKRLVDSDIVFAVSGGDSFSDIYGLGRFLYVTLPQLLALFAGKRLVLLPQTIGPFRHAMVRAAARYVLARAEAVYARDHASLDVARRLLGSRAGADRLRFCYDMAFDVDPVPPAAVHVEGLAGWPGAGGSPVVGFNVSGLLLAGGYTRDNMFGLRTDYRTLVHRLIGFLIERRQAAVLLIPHVFGDPGSIEGDDAACASIFEDLRCRYEGRIGLVRGRYDHTGIKHVIGLCDFFVGARMHACIGAISQHVPAVLLAYSRKFHGVMSALGQEDLVVDARKLDADEIVGALEKAYDRRHAIRSELETAIPKVKQAIRGALRDVDSAAAPAARHNGGRQ